jgi:hypothetical protein
MALDPADVCTVLQESLLPIAGANSPVNRAKTGFIESLVSPINREGFAQIEQSTDGIKKVVRVQYLQQPDASSVVSGPIGTVRPNLCTSTATATEPIGKTVDVTLEAFKEFSMSEATFREFCTWDMAAMRNWMLNIMIAPVIQRINQLLLTKWAAGVYGAYYGQGAPAIKSFQLLSGGSAANYIGFSDLQTEYMKFGGISKPILVGDGILNTYMNLVGIGCCNNNGIDLSQAAAKDAFFFYDIDASSATLGLGAANRFIMYSPGSMQMIQYLENQGEFMQIKPDYERRIMVDPVTGLSFDFEWRYESCDRKYYFSLGTAFDLFSLPDDMFAAGAMANVNKTVFGLATNA